MSEFLAQWLARASVMLPVMIVVAATCWLVLNKLGVMRLSVPLNGSDLRTWPFYFALGDATVFALTFSALAAWMGDSAAGSAVAGGLAAIVALGVAWLAAGRSPPSG